MRLRCFGGRCDSRCGFFILAQTCRPELRFEQPDLAVGIVVDQLFVLLRPQVAGPNYAGGVNVGFVVDPFVLEEVLRAVVMHKDEQLARHPGELFAHCLAPVRIVIDSRPSFEWPQRLRNIAWLDKVYAIPKGKVRRGEENPQTRCLSSKCKAAKPP